MFVFLCVYVLGSRYFQCFMVGLLSHHLCIDSQVVSECLLLGLIRGLKRSVNQGTKRVHPLACRRSKHLPWAHQTMKAWFSPAQSLFFYFEHLEWFWGPLVQSDQETKHRLYERVGKAILHSRMGAAFGTGALPNPPVRLRRSRSPQVELNTASNLCALNRAILFVNADDVRFSASGSEGVPAGKFLW